MPATEPYDYGWWPLVAFHVAFLVWFAWSSLGPIRRREWRSLGAFSAFVVALYTEMYGFPLTIYLLGTALGRLPFADPFAHASGNLWASLLLGQEWASFLMGLGGLVMIAGLGLVGAGFQQIHAGRGELVTDGLYRFHRHPQYAGLMLLVIGLLIQWPTLIGLLMGPALLVLYWRLARREDRELEARFGERYREYRARVPAFVHRLRDERGPIQVQERESQGGVR